MSGLTLPVGKANGHIPPAYEPSTGHAIPDKLCTAVYVTYIIYLFHFLFLFFIYFIIIFIFYFIFFRAKEYFRKGNRIQFISTTKILLRHRLLQPQRVRTPFVCVVQLLGSTPLSSVVHVQPEVLLA